jgi:glycosyltransferase involved in cell wall biosynthesis
MPKFDNTRYGFYRGFRWLILLREFFYLPFMLIGLLKAKHKWKTFDIVHVNEFVYIIPALLAKWVFGARLVVHVRALSQKDDASLRTRMINGIFKRWVDRVIAIDGNVRATLSPELSVDIINNSFTPVSNQVPDTKIVNFFESLPDCSLKVGFVGNVHYSKGIVEIFEAAKILSGTNKNVNFIIVGGGTTSDQGVKAWILARLGFAQNAGTDIGELVKKDALTSCFHMLGPTLNIKYVYDRIDVLLFPSHFDAPGRPVFEAGFSSVPSIVAVTNPTPDTFVHRETGLAIPAKDPQALAEAIEFFLDNPSERMRMGDSARELALRNFSPAINSKKLFDVYSKMISVK